MLTEKLEEETTHNMIENYSHGMAKAFKPAHPKQEHHLMMTCVMMAGQFTHRVAATTCCSQTGLACLNPMNLRRDQFMQCLLRVELGKVAGEKVVPSRIMLATCSQRAMNN